MAAHAVGLYNMQDLSWLPAYRAKVPALLAKQGGRYIARAVGSPWEVLEGTRPPITGVTIIEFPRWKRRAPGTTIRSTRP